MAKQSPLTYLPEVSGQERPDINVQTEEALNTLLNALEVRRQKPMFDPVGLATAGGFMKPTKTGSGWEALSNAIEAYTGARQSERQREIEDAQQYLGVIGQLGEIERRKRRDQQFMSSLGMKPETTLGAPRLTEEITVKERGPRGELVEGSEAYTPPGLEPTKGIQLLPPNKNIQTGRQYLRGAFLEGKVDYSEALKNAQEMERKRYEVRENGIVDLSTGIFYPTPKGELVERQLRDPDTGATGTYKIPSGIAMQLDHFQMMGKQDEYDALARRALGRREARPPREVGVQPGAPAARPGAGGLKTERQKKIEEERAKTTAVEEAKVDVEKEAALGANDDSARIMFQNAQILQDMARKSPQVFGLLQTPTVAAAIGTAIDEGISIGNTRISLGGFYDALLKVSGVKQEDIANLEIAASALAELELKYTQLYLKGQGQVTEGERLIVRRIAGTPKNSPEFITQKAKLIEMRSQYDIDVIDRFRDLKEQNPDMTWSQFERSKTFRDMRDDYNKRVSNAFGLKAAVPSGKRGQKSSSSLDVNSMREALESRGQE